MTRHTTAAAAVVSALEGCSKQALYFVILSRHAVGSVQKAEWASSDFTLADTTVSLCIWQVNRPTQHAQSASPNMTTHLNAADNPLSC
jgi:hypothetical protein